MPAKIHPFSRKGHAFHTQPQALLDRPASLHLDLASRADDAMPRILVRSHGSQQAGNRTVMARKARRRRHLSIRGDLAARNQVQRGRDGSGTNASAGVGQAMGRKPQVKIMKPEPHRGSSFGVLAAHPCSQPFYNRANLGDGECPASFDRRKAPPVRRSRRPENAQLLTIEGKERSGSATQLIQGSTGPWTPKSDRDCVSTEAGG